MIKKNVYYCDYCKKKGLSRWHLIVHEKHCTGNVHRECRVCSQGNDISKAVNELKKRFEWVERPSSYQTMTGRLEWEGGEITIKEIGDHADGCPACMLTIIRGLDISLYHTFDFNYQDAMVQWWAAVNEEEKRREEFSTY